MIFASADFGTSFILEIGALVLIGAFIAKYVSPPLKRAMEKKAESIRAQLNAGEEAKVAATQLVETRKQELERARAEAKQLVEQTRRAATQLVRDGEQRADAEYQRIVARTSVEIELERVRVRDEVMTEFADLILEAAHQVVDAELDDALHRHFIDTAIAAAEAQAQSTPTANAESSHA